MSFSKQEQGLKCFNLIYYCYIPLQLNNASIYLISHIKAWIWRWKPSLRNSMSYFCRYTMFLQKSLAPQLLSVLNNQHCLTVYCMPPRSPHVYYSPSNRVQQLLTHSIDYIAVWEAAHVREQLQLSCTWQSMSSFSKLLVACPLNCRLSFMLVEY